LPPLTEEELEKLTGGPTLVTYSGQNVPVADVVKVLVTAAGQDGGRPTLMLGKDTPATISVDWKNKPFWEAAQEVETLTGLSWTGFMGGLTLSTPTAGSANLSGTLIAKSPFVRIYSESLTHTKVSKSSLVGKTDPAPEASDTTQLVVKAYFDPKMRVLNGSLMALDVHVPDGVTVAQPQIQDLIPTYAQMINNYIVASTGNGSLIQSVMVTLPPGILSDTVLSKVTATARVLAMVSSKKWQVEDLANAADAQETNEKAQYTVDSVEVAGKQLKVQLMIERDANEPGMVQPMTLRMGIPANAMLNPGAVANPGAMAVVEGVGQTMRRTMAMGGGGRFGAFSGVTVKDANGKVLNLQGNALSMAGANPLRNQTKDMMTFDISDAVGPFSMTWYLPSTPRNVDTPFELDDLKVP
jgi:hypothetical protein